MGTGSGDGMGVGERRKSREGMAGIGADPRTRQFSAALALSFLAAVVLLMAVNVAASMAGPPPGSWSPTFDEEFNSAGLNTSTWTPGWQRNEVTEISERCVSPQNVSQPGDGYLHLSVQQTLPCGPRGLQETGAAVESNHGDGVAGHAGYSYSYGYVEWRVYLPGQANTGCPSGGCIGNWPALWTLPESHSSEIDVMEGLEKGLACYHFLPPFTGNEQHGACKANSYVGWHTFGADWEPGGVTYYYDGVAVGTEQSSGNSPSLEYLVMDVLPSRTTAPKLFNQAVLVDYVHVYQQLPIVTTGAATGKQPLQATLNGTVNANGTPLSSCHFDYGTSPSYGFSAPCSGPESGESATVSLTPGTTYHFRIVAANASGFANGYDETFTTPGPVEAVNGAATGVSQISATLNGNVNPRGYDAKYYFQYGDTAGYGSTTAEGDAGSGTGAVPVGMTVNTLTPATLYHYRLVATSGGVTSYSADATFYSLAWEDVFYRGVTGGLQNWYWNGTMWSYAPIGPENVIVGTPSAVLLPEGHIDVFYRSIHGGLQNWLWNGSTWSYSPIGPENAMAGDPHAIALPGGQMDVFYRGTDGGLKNWYWSTVNWSYGGIGPEHAMAGEPSPIALPEGRIDVFYRGTDGGLKNWYWSTPTWTYGSIGSGNAMAGDPFALALSGGHIDVFYRGVGGGLQNWYWSSPSWSYGALGSEGAMAGEPSAVALPEGHIDVFYRGADGGLKNWYWSTPAWTYGPIGSGSTMAGDPHAAVWPDGNMDVFYRGIGGGLKNWFWSPPYWSYSPLGGENAMGGDPDPLTW